VSGNRTLFFGFGAWVGSLKGVSTCGFWAEDPVVAKWQPAALIDVDLAMTPQAHRAGTIPIANIQVDDHTTNATPGRTQIGPLWPSGTTIGAVWLSETYYNSLATKPPRVPAGTLCQPYELTSALEWATTGELSERRFYGTHAEIVSVNGALALVRVWHPGTSGEPKSNPVTAWIDLAQSASPTSDGLSKIGTGSPVGSVGALFIDNITAGQLQLRGPKLPRSLGHSLSI